MNTAIDVLRPTLRAKLNKHLEKSKPKRNDYPKELAAWLEKTDWTFFCTFTTPYEMTLKSARRLMENYHRKLKENGIFSTMFWVAERFECKDGYHTHALMYVPCSEDFIPLARTTAFESWQKVSVTKTQESTREDGKVFNRADIQKIRPKKGTHYLCKYVTKPNSDYDLIN